MKQNNSIFYLVAILAIIIALIAGIYSYKYNPVNINEEKVNTSYNYVEFNSNNEKPSNRVIINDKFVSDVDKNSNIVVLGNDGTISNVKNGRVLVSNSVITSNDEEYSVYKINNPEKSVSSN